MIIKRRVTRAFVQLDNGLVRDKRLALDEHGMLHYLLSLPDSWEVKPKHLENYWGIGRDKRRRIFRSLVRIGWAQLEYLRADDGAVLGSRWIIGDEPGRELTEEEMAEGENAEDADEVTTKEATAAPESKTPDALASADRETPFQAVGSADSRVTRPPENPSPILRKTTEEDLQTTNTNTPPQDAARGQKPAGGVDDSDDGDGEPPPTFGEVLRLWPPENVVSAFACEKVFQRFNVQQKRAAKDGIRPYLSDCKSKGQTRLCDLRTYLDERRFDRFSRNGKPAQSFYVVHRATPQAVRWKEHFERFEPHRLRGFEDAMASRGVYTTVTEWPPSQTAINANNKTGQG
jgi:hypothetical protein